MTLKPILATDIPAQTKKTNYPNCFAHVVEGRTKRKLGDEFGLSNFGVNLTTLAPGAASALLHKHSKQDEFVYILSGSPTLVRESGEVPMSPGMVMGFAAGSEAHQLRNDTDTDVTYLEIGDRRPGDIVEYPNDDLTAIMVDGAWKMTRKDGSDF